MPLEFIQIKGIFSHTNLASFYFNLLHQDFLQMMKAFSNYTNETINFINLDVFLV